MKTLVLEFKKLESGNATKYSKKKKKKLVMKTSKKIQSMSEEILSKDILIYHW